MKEYCTGYINIFFTNFPTCASDPCSSYKKRTRTINTFILKEKFPPPQTRLNQVLFTRKNNHHDGNNAISLTYSISLQ